MKLTMPKGDGRPMGTELSLKVCYNYKYDDGWITNTKFKELVSEAFKEAVDNGQIDQIGDNPYMVNMMVFFGVTDLPTLSRLNLRFLLEGKHLCYKCKKELKGLMQKFSVSDVRKFNFKLPRGMTTRDDLCADCFNKLTR